MKSLPLRLLALVLLTAVPCGAAAEEPPEAEPASPPAEAETTTIAEHGDARIFLTGSCGVDGQGRRAILQNRNPYSSVQVTTETSRWLDGRFSTSRRHHHVLGPLEEKRLGCTAASPNLEERYALVRISDATRSDLFFERDRPARDFIAFVESGNCGRDRTGQRISVINEHGQRQIVVLIEYLVKVREQLTSRYIKAYRLSPGATIELGCNLDGELVREFHVLEAN